MHFGTQLDTLVHHHLPERTRILFGSRLAMCTTCGTPDQVVPCPHVASKGCNPINDGWRSDGQAVAKPYVALTAAWCSWAVPPHNSIRGRHHCTTASGFNPELCSVAGWWCATGRLATGPIARLPGLSSALYFRAHGLGGDLRV